MPKEHSNFNFTPVIILGCGPSSLSAAIQLKRTNIPFLMIAEEMGGIVQNANLIENLLGFPNGISGKEFASIMQKSIEHFEVPVIYDKIIDVKYEEERFWVTTHLGLEFSCEYLIIGTGTIPNTLNIPGEKKACATNRLFYNIYKFTGSKHNLHIGIIGSGDAAYDYALHLVDDTNSIEILQRGSRSKSLPLLAKRVKEKTNIKIKLNVSVRKIEIERDQLKIEIKSEKGLVSRNFDVIFVTIGRSPNIEFLSPDLTKIFKDESENKKLSTKLLFIGDVKNQNYRQLAIAMGDGIKTAIQIAELLHRFNRNGR